MDCLGFLLFSFETCLYSHASVSQGIKQGCSTPLYKTVIAYKHAYTSFHSCGFSIVFNEWQIQVLLFRTFQDFFFQIFLICISWISRWETHRYRGLTVYSILTDMWFANIFSQSVSYLFIILRGPFTKHIFNFGKPQCIDFSSYGFCFWY